MRRYKAYKVKYLGSTDFKGSRVKIKDCITDQSVTIAYDCSKQYAIDQARDFLESKGIRIAASCASEGGNFDDLLLTADFESALK